MNAEVLRLLYVTLTVGAGVTFLLFLLVQSRRHFLARRQRLAEIHLTDAVDAAPPGPDPYGAAKRLGFESIQNQFTITRRVLIPLVLVLTLMVASLPFMNRVPAATVSLVVGAYTVLIGIAARPFIENLIAGFVISTSKVLRIGDTVKIEEFYGTIEDINPTHTTIKLWDWRRYVVPNKRMLEIEFTSYSLHDEHVWACVMFWVDPEAELDLVERLAVEAARASPHWTGQSDPSFWVIGCERDALECWIAAWTASPADAWELRSETARGLMTRLRAHGIGTQGFRVKTGSSAARVPASIAS